MTCPINTKNKMDAEAWKLQQLKEEFALLEVLFLTQFESQTASPVKFLYLLTTFTKQQFKASYFDGLNEVVSASLVDDYSALARKVTDICVLIILKGMKLEFDPTFEKELSEQHVPISLFSERLAPEIESNLAMPEVRMFMKPIAIAWLAIAHQLNEQKTNAKVSALIEKLRTDTVKEVANYEPDAAVVGIFYKAMYKEAPEAMKSKFRMIIQLWLKKAFYVLERNLIKWQTNVFFHILSESLKDEDTLCEFWENFTHQDSFVHEMVNYALGCFPALHREDFIKVLKVLCGRIDRIDKSYSHRVLDFISRLPTITLRITDDALLKIRNEAVEIGKIGSKSKSSKKEIEEYPYISKSTFTHLITIPEGTPAKFIVKETHNTGIVMFKRKYCAWSYIFVLWQEFLADCRQQNQVELDKFRTIYKLIDLVCTILKFDSKLYEELNSLYRESHDILEAMQALNPESHGDSHVREDVIQLLLHTILIADGSLSHSKELILGLSKIQNMHGGAHIGLPGRERENRKNDLEQWVYISQR